MRAALAASLPRAYYVSDDIFRLERERIFRREGFCAGREAELPKVGDYKVLDVAGEGVLVVRSRQGDLRAFYNVCSHRGSALCVAAARGSAGDPDGSLAGSIRCPYHSWTYSLDGRLISAPHLGTLRSEDRDAFSLYPIGLETWGGVFFVNLTPGEAASRGDGLPAP